MLRLLGVEVLGLKGWGGGGLFTTLFQIKLILTILKILSLDETKTIFENLSRLNLPQVTLEGLIFAEINIHRN